MWKFWALTLTLTLTPGISTSQETDAWTLLSAVEIREDGVGAEWRAVKTFPPALQDGAEAFRLSGYLVPVTAEPYISTFLLVKSPDNCPFCGTDSSVPAVEVHMDRPLPDMAEFSRITVEGELVLNEDPYTTQAVSLVGARRIAPES